MTLKNREVVIEDDSLEGWIKHYGNQPTPREVYADAERNFQQTMGILHSHVSTPCKQTAPSEPEPPKNRRRTLKEKKNDKSLLPQKRTLEGPGGVHHIMQKRPAPLIEIAPPIQELVWEETADHNRFYPRRKGWGPHRSWTRAQFCDHVDTWLEGKGKDINLLFTDAENQK